MMPKSLENSLETSTSSKLMLGPHLIVQGKVLIPVVEVYAGVLPKLHAGWMAASPKALVVVERGGATALPITEESVSFTQLSDDLPDLATRIEHARKQLAT